MRTQPAGYSVEIPSVLSPPLWPAAVGRFRTFSRCLITRQLNLGVSCPWALARRLVAGGDEVANIPRYRPRPSCMERRRLCREPFLSVSIFCRTATWKPAIAPHWCLTRIPSPWRLPDTSQERSKRQFGRGESVIRRRLKITLRAVWRALSATSLQVRSVRLGSTVSVCGLP